MSGINTDITKWTLTQTQKTLSKSIMEKDTEQVGDKSIAKWKAKAPHLNILFQAMQAEK